MRTSRLLISVAVLCGATATSEAASKTEPDAITHQVVTGNNLYFPGDTTVAPTPPITIFEGDSLEHTNVDSDLHNLESLAARPSGQPWFLSELIGAGDTAPVPVEDVPPGLYAFTCTIHPFMGGTLQVRPAPIPAEPEEPPAEVSSGDSFFAPQTLTIKVGTTVRWTNNGSLDHTVTASDGSWDSHPACPSTSACWNPGETYSRTFTAPGVVPYYCKLHGTPSGGGHAGTIVVTDPASTPTSVTGIGASPGAGTVTVSGSASFGGEPRNLIAQDITGDSPGGPQTAQFGVDLVSGQLSRPDPARNEIEFVWKVTQLDGAPPPEVVRYMWQMKVGPSAKEYWIQAKTADLLSGTNVADDPQGHAGHLQGAFKLRGNCGPIVAQVPNVTTCRHVAWLDGTFDAARDEIRVRVPLGMSSAPEFAPGATIAPFGVIEAGFQVSASTTTTADEVTNNETPYTIAQKGVSLGIAPAGTPLGSVSFSTPASLSGGDSFSGSLNTSGLAAGSYDVWAKACFGANCGTRSTRITI